MKKYILWAASVAFIAGLAACGDDSDTTTDPSSEGHGTVTAYDQLNWFQNNIVKVDSAGNMMCRLAGEPLNTNDTTKLSIGVNDVDTAKIIFLSWLAPDAKYTTDGNKIIFKPHNEKGEAQGTITFEPTTDNGNILAKVTFSSDTNIKLVSSVSFIKSSAWPSNADEPTYCMGDTCIYYDCYKVGYTYVCIRTKKRGEPSLWISTSSIKHKNGEIYFDNSYHEVRHFNAICRYCVSTAEAKIIHTIIKSNYEYFCALFKDVGINYNNGIEYWTSDCGSWVGSPYSIVFNEDKDDVIDWWYWSHSAYWLMEKTR